MEPRKYHVIRMLNQHHVGTKYIWPTPSDQKRVSVLSTNFVRSCAKSSDTLFRSVGVVYCLKERPTSSKIGVCLFVQFWMLTVNSIYIVKSNNLKVTWPDVICKVYRNGIFSCSWKEGRSMSGRKVSWKRLWVTAAIILVRTALLDWFIYSAPNYRERKRKGGEKQNWKGNAFFWSGKQMILPGTRKVREKDNKNLSRPAKPITFRPANFRV
jgi:hypothetical protein